MSTNMGHGNHDMIDHSKMNHSMPGATTLDPHAGHDMHNMSGDMPADHNMGDHSMHGMMMYFHASENSTILFSCWKTTSWQTMLGSCFAIFILAALYEGLKVLREHLLRRAMISQRYQSVPVPTNEDTTVAGNDKNIRSRMLTLSHFIQSLLHVLQVVISYFLMLIFMTYNVWLCMAVALGAGTGYFLFSWKRALVIDVNEHCH